MYNVWLIVSIFHYICITICITDRQQFTNVCNKHNFQYLMYTITWCGNNRRSETQFNQMKPTTVQPLEWSLILTTYPQLSRLHLQLKMYCKLPYFNVVRCVWSLYLTVIITPIWFKTFWSCNMEKALVHLSGLLPNIYHSVPVENVINGNILTIFTVQTQIL